MSGASADNSGNSSKSKGLTWGGVQPSKQPSDSKLSEGGGLFGSAPPSSGNQMLKNA